jgi:hypothetical protein
MSELIAAGVILLIVLGAGVGIGYWIWGKI